MKQLPLIDANNTVVNIISIEDGANWTAPAGLTLGVAGGKIGDHWDGSAYTTPVITPTKTDLIAHAQIKRAAVVDAGCVVAGVPIWTDSAAQASLTGAVVASQVIGAAFAAKWKGRDGNFYPMTATTMVQLAMGAMTFVNTAFGVESAVKDAVNTGTITTLSQIDAYPWPSNG
jgi:hypothetical protein